MARHSLERETLVSQDCRVMIILAVRLVARMRGETVTELLGSLEVPANFMSFFDR